MAPPRSGGTRCGADVRPSPAAGSRITPPVGWPCGGRASPDRGTMADMARAGTPDDLFVIDVDTHLTEPHDLWTSRAPQAAGRTASRRCATSTAPPTWTIDGDRLRAGPSVRRSCRPDGAEVARHRVPQRGPSRTPTRRAYDDRRRASQVMDELGIYAQILYPNVVGFGGQKFVDVIDPELRLLCATDLQRRHGRDPGRLGRAPVPHGAHAVVGHRRRRRRGRSGPHALGLRGVNTNSDPQNRGLPDLGERALGPVVGGLRRPRDAGELPHRRQRDDR